MPAATAARTPMPAAGSVIGRSGSRRAAGRSGQAASKGYDRKAAQKRFGTDGANRPAL